MFHVFEHLSDAASIMDLLQEIVAEGGYVVISIPDIESWQARFFKGKWFHLDPPRHLIFFSHQQLKQHFLKRGFYLIRRSFVSPEQNPFGAIQSILNQWFAKRDVLYERLKGNKEYANDYSRLLIFAQKFFFMTAFPFFVITDLIAAIFRKSASFTMVFRKGEV